jgi:hypothetical protein
MPSPSTLQSLLASPIMADARVQFWKQASYLGLLPASFSKGLASFVSLLPYVSRKATNK